MSNKFNENVGIIRDGIVSFDKKCIIMCTLLLKKSSKLIALVELGLSGSIFGFILPSKEFEILNNFVV